MAGSDFIAVEKDEQGDCAWIRKTEIVRWKLIPVEDLEGWPKGKDAHLWVGVAYTRGGQQYILESIYGKDPKDLEDEIHELFS